MNAETEKSDGKLRCSMYFPAPVLKQEEIENILDPARASEHHFIQWFERFFNMPRNCFHKELLERFIQINTQESFMTVYPVGTAKLENLEHSLRDSCRCYCFGLETASIALSGAAAETLTQMIWEMSKLTVKGKPVDSSKEKSIFGKEFDSPYLSQGRRLQIILACELITLDQFEKLDFIRASRNNVVHFDKKCTKKEDQVRAIECYQKCITLFKEITAIEIKDGKISAVNPYFLSD